MLNTLTKEDNRFFYAMALYEHNEFTFLSEGISQVKDCELLKVEKAEGSGGSLKDGLTWMVTTTSQKISSTTPQRAVARITLTSTLLIVEANSVETLDALKHQLASILGFSLHFKGETLTPPTSSSPSSRFAIGHLRCGPRCRVKGRGAKTDCRVSRIHLSGMGGKTFTFPQRRNPQTLL